MPMTGAVNLICPRPWAQCPRQFDIAARSNYDPPDYTTYRLMLFENLFVGIVWGVYLVCYFASIHILLGKPGFTKSPPRMLMFGITTFMFVLGIVALVLETVLGLQQASYLDPWLLFDNFSQGIYVISAVMATIARLMYILSDIICAWRAVVLWNRDKRVITILLLFVIGTTAVAGCDLVLYFMILFGRIGPHPDINNIAHMASRDLYLRLIMIGPILGTNVLSTGLIAWKAWQRRSLVRKHLGEGTGSVRVERVFALFVESGFVYCCLWIVYLISAFMSDSGFVYQVVGSILLFASGLYPTLIVVLVGMQKSPIEHYSTFSTGMRFASGPALEPPRTGGVPRPVYMICRETVDDSDAQVPFTVFRETSDGEKPESL